jgi:hypothetical protein
MPGWVGGSDQLAIGQLGKKRSGPTDHPSRKNPIT